MMGMETASFFEECGDYGLPRVQSALAMTLLFTRGEVQGRARAVGDAGPYAPFTDRIS